MEWRARRLCVRQRKTGGVLWLPLTDEVATALLDYLREGRPQLAVRRYRRGFQTDPRQYREVFLRCRTPAGVLQSTAIAEAFRAWSRRSGLKIPFQGVHCLRHWYALHLLRSGLSLKTIGDLLGHRSSESTCVYLRLATDDLREVALSFPASASVSPAGRRMRDESPSSVHVAVGTRHCAVFDGQACAGTRVTTESVACWRTLTTS